MDAMYEQKQEEFEHCNLHRRSTNEFAPEASLVCYTGNLRDYHAYDLKTVMEKTDDDEYFVITRVHRDDLDAAGFDASQVDDATMERLADKMGDDYLEQLFWVHLPILAEYLEIPRKDEEEEDEESFVVETHEV